MKDSPTFRFQMPGNLIRHGYLAVCIVSAVCILVELVIFKWKKWL